MADKYGIPEGGDPRPGKVKYYKDNKKQLSWEQVAAATDEAGWSKESQTNWTYAIAVTGSESGRHPAIYNTYKKGHFGLFQISRAAWPEFFAGDSEAWMDPVQNARKAYEIYKKQGWGAWEGDRYTHFLEASNGLQKYRANKGEIKDSLADWVVDKATGGSADTVQDVTGPDGVSGVLGDAWEAVTTPAFWMRLAYGLTGVVLIVGGLMLIVRTNALKQVSGTVGKALGGQAGEAAQAAQSITKNERAAQAREGGSK